MSATDEGAIALREDPATSTHADNVKTPVANTAQLSNPLAPYQGPVDTGADDPVVGQMDPDGVYAPSASSGSIRDAWRWDGTGCERSSRAGVPARDRFEMRKSRSYWFQVADRGRTEARLSGSESFQNRHRAATSRTPPERTRSFGRCFGKRRGRIGGPGQQRDAER